MESKLQVSDKGDLLDFSLDGGIATQGTERGSRGTCIFSRNGAPLQASLKPDISSSRSSPIRSSLRRAPKYGYSSTVSLSGVEDC